MCISNHKIMHSDTVGSMGVPMMANKDTLFVMLVDHATRF